MAKKNVGLNLFYFCRLKWNGDLGELYGMKKLIYNNLHTLAF